MKVWGILSDFKNYSAWNNFLSNVSGNLIEGERLKVTISPPGGKPMTFFPALLTIKQGNELRWRGKFICRFLFQGEHYFILEYLSEDGTKLIHGERFSGALTFIFNLFGMQKKTLKGFQMFNEALKKKIENV